MKIVQQYPSCYIIFGCLRLNFGRLDDGLNVEIAGLVALMPSNYVHSTKVTIYKYKMSLFYDRV